LLVGEVLRESIAAIAAASSSGTLVVSAGAVFSDFSSGIEISRATFLGGEEIAVALGVAEIQLEGPTGDGFSWAFIASSKDR
jgi:hypothetical protein